MKRTVATLSCLLCAAVALSAEARAPACPGDMALIPSHGASPAFCIDRYEATTIELDARGRDTAPHSAFTPVAGKRVRAVSRAGAFPQAYISRDEAETACKASHKRLCSEDEWVFACKGKVPTVYPYDDVAIDGYCNDNGKSPLGIVHGADVEAAYASPVAMNDPQLNQLPGTLARSGSHTKCRNAFGVFDMVGNVHEWVADKAGTFRGGYYLDVHKNGDGCNYRTTAHDATYHDYSTGFRCCR